MAHSYSNKSNGGSEKKSDSGPFHLPIGGQVKFNPPAGKDNSYEKIRVKIDAHDRASMNKDHYTREKLDNK